MLYYYYYYLNHLSILWEQLEPVAAVWGKKQATPWTSLASIDIKSQIQ